MMVAAVRRANAGAMDAFTPHNHFVNTSASEEDVTAPPAKKVLRRACDCCRKRKVKCDGEYQCGPCRKVKIPCAYNEEPKKKGPKRLRSQHVLTALRIIQADATKVDGPKADAANANTEVPTSTLRQQILSKQHTSSNVVAWNAESAYTAAHPVTPAHLHEPARLPLFSIAQEQQHRQYAYIGVPSVPIQQQHSPQQAQYSSQYFSQPEALPTHAGYGHADFTFSPATITYGPPEGRFPGDRFIEHLHRFFAHMYPIMPVINRKYYLRESLYDNTQDMDYDTYCFLCAICAATIVQLAETFPQTHSTTSTTAKEFADECLRERKNYDFIEAPTNLTVLTSFFLFAFNGNHEHGLKLSSFLFAFYGNHEHGLKLSSFLFAFYGNHEKGPKLSSEYKYELNDYAWYYLQEAITLAQNLRMGDEEAYGGLDPIESKQTRRIYWLLFITERAYAVQTKREVRLKGNIEHCAVRRAGDTLISGFVTLAKLFAAVDDEFVLKWRDMKYGRVDANVRLLKQVVSRIVSAVDPQLETSQTQRLDISVTQQWLLVVVWQMGSRLYQLDEPIKLARNVVEITSSADELALNSHGIGMEQKIFDVGSCVANVLNDVFSRIPPHDTGQIFKDGKHYMRTMLVRLSDMRGKRSRYLDPLLMKVDSWMGTPDIYHTLPPPSPSSSDCYIVEPPLPSDYDVQVALPPSDYSIAETPSPSNFHFGNEIDWSGRISELASLTTPNFPDTIPTSDSYIAEPPSFPDLGPSNMMSNWDWSVLPTEWSNADSRRFYDDAFVPPTGIGQVYEPFEQVDDFHGFIGGTLTQHSMRL